MIPKSASQSGCGVEIPGGSCTCCTHLHVVGDVRALLRVGGHLHTDGVCCGGRLGLSGGSRGLEVVREGELDRGSAQRPGVKEVEAVQGSDLCAGQW